MIGYIRASDLKGSMANHKEKLSRRMLLNVAYK